MKVHQLHLHFFLLNFTLNGVGVPFFGYQIQIHRVVFSNKKSNNPCVFFCDVCLSLCLSFQPSDGSPSDGGHRRDFPSKAATTREWGTLTALTVIFCRFYGVLKNAAVSKHKKNSHERMGCMGCIGYVYNSTCMKYPRSQWDGWSRSWRRILTMDSNYEGKLYVYNMYIYIYIRSLFLKGEELW